MTITAMSPMTTPMSAASLGRAAAAQGVMDGYQPGSLVEPPPPGYDPTVPIFSGRQLAIGYSALAAAGAGLVAGAGAGTAAGVAGVIAGAAVGAAVGLFVGRVYDGTSGQTNVSPYLGIASGVAGAFVGAKVGAAAGSPLAAVVFATLGAVGGAATAHLAVR